MTRYKFKGLVDKFVKRLIEQYCDVWGVEFESNLPPEFIITEHGELRLQQRVRCNKDKMIKIVRKAWKAPEPDIKTLYTKTNKYYDGFSAKAYYIHYRQLMGYIFVFAIRRAGRQTLTAQKILVTVFN